MYNYLNRFMLKSQNMAYLIINGGKKLNGVINNQTAKNSAVAIMCACVMVPGKVELVDVPEIEEVYRIIELLKSIGVKVFKKSNGRYLIDSSKQLDINNIDKNAFEKTRSSLFLFGALARRQKKYILPKSGGCKLGERTVRPHLYALENLGIKIKSNKNHYSVENPGNLKGAKIIMYESGDTATENAIMASVLAKGKTIIKMASANYMVQDLCHFLNKAGAKISGIGSTTLIIEGVKNLRAGLVYPIMPDPIVAMTYISIGVVTGSSITIKNCPIDFLELELLKLSKMGQKFSINNTRRSKNGEFEVVDIQLTPSRLNSLPDKIECRPFPGLNIDNLPLFIPILSTANGRTLVHDWPYENRAVHYLEMQKIGVNITLLDPHRIIVEGPSLFKANEAICPPILRVAVILLVGMLAAKGKSILRNTYMIDRGYEKLYETLNKMGADITQIEK
jgi:UDP-N-acetylglucosamine 1-carboxyvinyltransferase